MLKSTHFKFLTAIAITAIAVAGCFTASGQLFTLEDYPGGYTKETFEYLSEASIYPTRITLEIIPHNDDNYKTIMNFEEMRKREDLTSFSPLFSILSGPFMREEHEKDLWFKTLEALYAIDNKEVKSNQDYKIHPHGTLKTDVRTYRKGIEVTMATFTSPSLPNQRAKVAIPSLEDRKLLLFLPLLQLEEMKGGQWIVTTKMELIEFEHMN